MEVVVFGVAAALANAVRRSPATEPKIVAGD